MAAPANWNIALCIHAESGPCRTRFLSLSFSLLLSFYHLHFIANEICSPTFITSFLFRAEGIDELDSIICMCICIRRCTCMPNWSRAAFVSIFSRRDFLPEALSGDFICSFVVFVYIQYTHLSDPEKARERESKRLLYTLFRFNFIARHLSVCANRHIHLRWELRGFNLRAACVRAVCVLSVLFSLSL